MVEEAGARTDCLVGIREELADRAGPTGFRSGVGVDPSDDVAGRAVETCITRGDDAWPLLCDDTQLGDAVGEPGNDLRRLICGVVVDDDDLVELVQFGHQGLE